MVEPGLPPGILTVNGRVLPLFLALQWLSGCVLEQDPAKLRVLLDDKSAVTVETMAEPYVLACEAPGLAANSRDYLDMRILDTDRMGSRAYFLSLIAFSTVDRHGATNVTVEGLHRVTVHAGGAAIPLEEVPAADEAHGLSDRLFAHRNGQVVAKEYRLSAEQVIKIAGASPANFKVEIGDPDELVYTPWSPAVEELKRIAEHAHGRSR